MPSAVAAAPARVQVLQYSSSSGAIDDWVHVYRARDYLEANLAVGRLQEEGLHARVDMENAAMLGAWAGTGAGGTNVQVLVSEVQAARAVIDEINEARAARRAAASVACPICGHAPAKRGFRPLGLTALAAVLLSFVSAFVTREWDMDDSLKMLLPLALFAGGVVSCFFLGLPRWRCTACGHQWSQAEPVETEEEDAADEPRDDAG